MKKEFTEDQLSLIRDIFGDLCENSLERGNRENAQEELDIINVIQSQCGYDEYESLEDFYENESGDWSEIKKREKLELEEAAISKLIEYAKSEETVPSQDLRDAVNAELEECHANSGRTKSDKIEARKITISALIIGCISKCSSWELKKLDRAKETLAQI